MLMLSVIALAASQLLIKGRFSTILPWGTQLDRKKIAVLAADPTLWCAGSLLILSALCWYVALVRLPLSVMMPTAAIVAPLVSISAHFFLGEPMSVQKASAIALIAGGVAWLGFQEL